MAKRGGRGNGFTNDVIMGIVVGTIGGVALSQFLNIGPCNPISGVMDGGEINFDCFNPLSWLPGSG